MDDDSLYVYTLLVVCVRPFSIALGAIIVFQIILIILDILIFCYHPRDSWEQILYKSGTVAKTRFQVPV